MRSNVHNLRLKCEECKKVKLKKWQRANAKQDQADTEEDETTDEEEEGTEKTIKGEKASHCHCHLFEVDQDLMATMSNGQPCKRYKADLKRKKEEEIEEKRIREPAKKADQEKSKRDLKIELQRHRRKLKEDANERSKQVWFFKIFYEM